MKVRIRGCRYVSRSGEECPPYSLVDLRADEAVDVVACGVGDLEDSSVPAVETTMAVPLVERRAAVSEGEAGPALVVPEVQPLRPKKK